MWISGSNSGHQAWQQNPNLQNHLAAQIYGTFNFNDHIFNIYLFFLIGVFFLNILFFWKNIFLAVSGATLLISVFSKILSVMIYVFLPWGLLRIYSGFYLLVEVLRPPLVVVWVLVL